MQNIWYQPVPDHSSVRQFDVGHVLPQSIHLLNTLLHDGAGPEHGGVGLHGLLHLEPDGGGVHVSLGVPHLVDVGDTRLASVVRQRSDSFTRLGIFSNGLSASASKDNLGNTRVK